MLTEDVFEVVIKSTPLVSIDIILKNTVGDVLLGKRNNRPAKGRWFVPGGRVLKDEPIDLAFKRLIENELGLKKEVSSNFKGIYQHFYDNNFFGNTSTTHYVVLAYEVNFNGSLLPLPEEQHSDYKWFTRGELLLNEQVHEHTKWYFQSNKQADKSFK